MKNPIGAVSKNPAFNPIIRTRRLAISLDGSNAQSLLQRMQPRSEPATQRRLGSGTIAFDGTATASSAKNRSVSVITGVPLGDTQQPAPTSAEQAVQKFCALDGAFNAVHWDANSETLVVVSDVLGKAPLYWRRSRLGLSLFTETKAVSGEPDLACWGAFLSMGHCLGTGTLLDGVERFPPATILRFHTRQGHVSMERYWHWPAVEQRVRLDDLIDALTANVKQYAGVCSRHTLFLSGGCDSRLMLYLMERAGIDARARIVAHDDEFGDADGKCAVAAARQAAIPFEVCKPAPGYFASQAYLDYVTAIDGSVPSLGLFIAKLYNHIPDSGFWDGLMLGGLLRDFKNPGNFRTYTAQAVAGWNHVNWQAARQLFGDAVTGAMFADFQEAFGEVRKEYADHAEDVARFTVEHRGRHRTSQNPLKAFADRGIPLIPGMHREVLALAACLPYAARRGSRMYLDMLQKINPRALKAPLISGGHPVHRTAIDLSARRMEMRASLDARIRAHPRLARRLRVSPAPIPVPEFARDCLEMDADPWINTEPLRNADPRTWEGFVLWRLYFHWSAWRALHSSDHLRGTPGLGVTARTLRASAPSNDDDQGQVIPAAANRTMSDGT